MFHSQASNPTQAKLTDQFVAFIDLLGFREEMVSVAKNSAKNPEDADKLLADFQSTVAQTVRKVLMPSEEWHIWSYRGFTDNFVIAIPMEMHEGDDSENWFGTIATRIAEFQFQLALQGWFVRGGLAMGKFYMDDLTVFGPALVDAYLLESTYARDPRIILGDTVVKLVKSHLQYYGSGYDSPQNMSVMVDVDGRAFINYLFEAIDGGVEEQGITAIKQHKMRVEERLIKHQNIPTIWAKYRWVASYHDFFCKTWLPEHKDELLISSKALAASPRLLVDKP